MVPGGRVLSQSVQAVPKGWKRGVKMTNWTPALRRQKQQTGADLTGRDFLGIMGWVLRHVCRDQAARGQAVRTAAQAVS